MIRFKTIFILVKKELTSFLDSPASYIAAIVFLVLWQFLFFRSAFLVGESSLRQLYDFLPWLALFFSAALTMGAFSMEKSEGTLELLLTHPVKEFELVIAKFFSTFIYQVIVFMFAFPIALSFSFFGPIDWGVVFTQVVSSAFLAACFISLGLFLSSMLAGQIAALLTTVGMLFILVILGSELVTAHVPLSLVPILEQVSILTHVASMSRGVIDVRDLWYFVSFVAVFLSLTALFLYRRKYGNRRDYFRSFQWGTYLFIGIAILTNILGARIPGRLDVTANKQFTLSSATQKSLSGLTDIVTITLYASSRLPTQFVPVVREIKDVLRDYSRIGKGNLTISIKDPSENEKDAQDATKQGIKEMQFNVIGQEELQLKTGYLGIVVSYADKHEVLPFIESTNDLEYHLTSAIAKLTNKDKKTIVFLSGHNEKSPDRDYGLFKNELEKQFVVSTEYISGGEIEIATGSSVIVIAGPTSRYSSSTQKALNSFMKKGLGILYLSDGYEIDQQLLSAQPNQVTDTEFLTQFGVTIEQNMVYDVRSNETVRIGQGVVGFLLPYPYWMRTFGVKDSLGGPSSDGVVLPWASSVTLNEDKLKEKGMVGGAVLQTSQFGGIQTGVIQLTPDKAHFQKENLKEQVTAVYVNGNAQNGNTMGRLIVVGNSLFFADQFVQNAPANAAFGLSAISWLSQQESFSVLRSKQIFQPKLLFSSSVEPMAIRFGNMALAVLIPVGLAVYRLLRRRKLMSLSYHK